jgi:hypothetical protein
MTMKTTKANTNLVAAVDAVRPLPVTTAQETEQIVGCVPDMLRLDSLGNPITEPLKYGAEIVESALSPGHFNVFLPAFWLGRMGKGLFWCPLVMQRADYCGVFRGKADALATLNAAPPPPGWVEPTDDTLPDAFDGCPADVGTDRPMSIADAAVISRERLQPPPVAAAAENRDKIQMPTSEAERAELRRSILLAAHYVVGVANDVIWSAAFGAATPGTEQVDRLGRYTAELLAAIDRNSKRIWGGA